MGTAPRESLPGQDGNVIQQLPDDATIFGASGAMKALRQRLEKTAATNVPILLEGEGGTGKEMLARWIHQRSPWKAARFVKVNCAAIPGTLLESELFGFEKGAFTGATYRKPGRIESADGGTLFLDEITEIESGLQAKLLQFLQDGRFSRIGDSEERRAEMRTICATHKNLEDEVDRGRFRKDLFYRVNVVRVKLPLLSERREDIPQLAEYFRIHYMNKFGMAREPFDTEFLRYMRNLPWPGNIRELSNFVARYVLIGVDGDVPDDNGHKKVMRPDGVFTAGPVSLKQLAKEATRDMERKLVLDALRANHWNRRRAAEALKISYRALIYKIRNTGIPSRQTAKGQNSEG